MSKVDEYRLALKQLKDWEPYLRKNSGLPGPRGNLELAQAASELASKPQIEGLLRIPPEQAPENSTGVFLVFCGVTALGRCAARGEDGYLQRMRPYASDSRWRIREAVATGLQYVGDADMPALIREMETWARGNWYEKRAAAAALAEPRLLKDPRLASKVLHILDDITASMASAGKSADESFRVLRQGMGYCWSVVAVAAPDEGKRLMEKWMASANPDIRWMMRENLKKNRLSRLDPKWTEKWTKRLQKETPQPDA